MARSAYMCALNPWPRSIYVIILAMILSASKNILRRVVVDFHSFIDWKDRFNKNCLQRFNALLDFLLHYEYSNLKSRSF